VLSYNLIGDSSKEHGLLILDKVLVGGADLSKSDVGVLNISVLVDILNSVGIT
jgi:hypothetical protein